MTRPSLPGPFGRPLEGGSREKELRAINVIRTARQGELARALEAVGQQALADIDEDIWSRIEKSVKADLSWMHTREELGAQVAPLAEAPSLVLARGPLETRLRKAQKGRGPGPTGLTYEHLQLALRYASTWDSYVKHAEAMVNHELPDRYYHWLTYVPLVPHMEPSGAIWPRGGPETARRNINSAVLEQQE